MSSSSSSSSSTIGYGTDSQWETMKQTNSNVDLEQANSSSSHDNPRMQEEDSATSPNNTPALVAQLQEKTENMALPSRAMLIPGGKGTAGETTGEDQTQLPGGVETAPEAQATTTDVSAPGNDSLVQTPAPEEPQVEECSICVEEITSLAYVIPCGHSFDYECIRRWLKEPSFSEEAEVITCPLCRQNVTSVLHYRLNGIVDNHPAREFCWKLRQKYLDQEFLDWGINPRLVYRYERESVFRSALDLEPFINQTEGTQVEARRIQEAVDAEERNIARNPPRKFCRRGYEVDPVFSRFISEQFYIGHDAERSRAARGNDRIWPRPLQEDHQRLAGIIQLLEWLKSEDSELAARIESERAQSGPVQQRTVRDFPSNQTTDEFPTLYERLMAARYTTRERMGALQGELEHIKPLVRSNNASGSSGSAPGSGPSRFSNRFTRINAETSHRLDNPGITTRQGNLSRRENRRTGSEIDVPDVSGAALRQALDLDLNRDTEATEEFLQEICDRLPRLCGIIISSQRNDSAVPAGSISDEELTSLDELVQLELSDFRKMTVEVLNYGSQLQRLRADSVFDSNDIPTPHDHDRRILNENLIAAFAFTTCLKSTATNNSNTRTARFYSRVRIAQDNWNFMLTLAPLPPSRQSRPAASQDPTPPSPPQMFRGLSISPLESGDSSSPSSSVPISASSRSSSRSLSRPVSPGSSPPASRFAAREPSYLPHRSISPSFSPCVMPRTQSSSPEISRILTALTPTSESGISSSRSPSPIFVRSQAPSPEPPHSAPTNSASEASTKQAPTRLARQ